MNKFNSLIESGLVGHDGEVSRGDKIALHGTDQDSFLLGTLDYTNIKHFHPTPVPEFGRKARNSSQIRNNYFVKM